MNNSYKHLANILTLTNLILGLVSIFLSIKGRFELSVIFILLAGLVDVFDGRVARKLQITSDIGKYLDSNSDLVSFGVAPAILIYFSVLDQFNILGPVVAAIFVVCSSYRLAKFNSVEFKGYFIGVPTTIAGALLALSVPLRNVISPNFLIVTTVILSFLMVAPLKVKKPT